MENATHLAVVRERLLEEIGRFELAGTAYVEWWARAGQACDRCTKRDMKRFSLEELRELASTNFCVPSTSGEALPEQCAWCLKPIWPR